MSISDVRNKIEMASMSIYFLQASSKTLNCHESKYDLLKTWIYTHLNQQFLYWTPSSFSDHESLHLRHQQTLSIQLRSTSQVK